MSFNYLFPRAFLYVLTILFCLNIYSQSSVTDIQLSNQNIDENTTGFIAEISSVSENDNDVFIYQLVSGDGDTNNSYFEIINDNQLSVIIPFDFESNSNPSLRIKSFLSSTAGSNDLILKGIIDFTTPIGGSSGKAIHLTAVRDIEDLSLYGLGVANNGGGTDGVEYIFPEISANEGDQILVARQLNEFNQYLDSSQYWDIILDASGGNGNITQNGDDAIELFINVATDESGYPLHDVGDVIETFGDINVDGTGESWEYLDAWAYKNNTGEWTFGEVNCTDGSSTHLSVPEDCIYPFVNGDSGITYFASETEVFEKSFDITVNDINDAPVPDNIEADAIEQTPIDITLTATDQDSDQIVSYSVDGIPINGFLTDPENNNSPLLPGSLLSGNTITYTSNSDSATADYFTYLASDANLTSDSAGLVNITIDPVEDDSSIHLSASAVEENFTGPMGSLTIYDPDDSNPPASQGLETIASIPMAGNNINNVTETLSYTGTYTLELTEDYGDGSNGGLINIFLDGELIIENATIEEPDDFDGNDCWPNCVNSSSAIYTFYATADQVISFESVQEPQYYDNDFIHIYFSIEEVSISSVDINTPINYSETLSYTGTYTLELTEDYGDGTDALTNIFLDGELIIENATISSGPLEPGGNDCWNTNGGPDSESEIGGCIVQSSAVYTFYATAGQTISYETVSVGSYDDNAFIHLTFPIENSQEEYELVSGEGDTDNDKFQLIGKQLFLENSVDFEEQDELSIRVKSTDDSDNEIETVLLLDVINENDIYINSTMPLSYCVGDGMISIDNVFETVGDLTYSWSGPNNFSSSNLTIENLQPGEYTLIVSDQYFDYIQTFDLEVEEIYNDLEICYITSDSENYTNNRIYLNSQGNYNIQEYQIYRETSALNEYELIGSVSSDESSYLDTETNNQQQQKKYKVATLDSCGNISALSSAHYNTLLSATVAVDGSVSLEWQPYVGIDYSTFNIWRSIDQDEFTLLSQLPSDQFNYNDTEADIDTYNYEYYVGIEVQDCESSRSVNDTVELRSNLLNVGVLSNTEFDIFNQISIYPNPAEDFVIINIEGNLQLIGVEIYNTIGQLINRSKDTIISTENLRSGLYVFKVQTDKGVAVKNIVVK